MDNLKNILEYTSKLPLAKVLETKQSKYYNNGMIVCVLCPYCNKKHYHGTNNKVKEDIRNSDCFNGEYKILLP